MIEGQLSRGSSFVWVELSRTRHRLSVHDASYSLSAYTHEKAVHTCKGNFRFRPEGEVRLGSCLCMKCNIIIDL